MKEVLSPFSQTNNVVLFREIECSHVIERYKKTYDIDVSEYFLNISKVQIYTCLDTQYQFYYPFDLSGSGLFYEQLQSFEWYYMPWRWEHEKALAFLNSNMKVLEIGCAEGNFLNTIKSKVNNVVGLELNQKALGIAKKIGLEVYDEFIQEYANDNQNEFDFVCSFQVLEHISQVHSFIEAQVRTLKKGGLLWISVPNRDAFPSLDWENDILNMPPHHMGLWNEVSLRNIENLFPIKLQEIIFEPLQPHHYQWYQNIIEKLHVKNKVQSIIYYRLGGKKRYAKQIQKNANSIKGHTIVAVYQKL